MKFTFCFLCLILGCWGHTTAQLTYTLDQSIPVEVLEGTLPMPWAGGINSAQVNKLDLNGDNIADLVIFDRAADKILTYLSQNNRYVYAPEYASLFPKEVTNWMLLRDFNCDGRKDIFTGDPFGVAVFVNTTKPGAQLTWRAFNPGFPLLTKGFSGNINLKVNDNDIPAIDDVDGDGDLDVLAIRFVGIGSVEWHKNLSIETRGRCDSLMLERVTQTWGEFTECNCGSFDFGTGCKTLGGRTQHAGGKSLALYDLNNDGDRDLIFSEESCARLYLLENNGSKTNARMTASALFPSVNPAFISFFPAAYFEDVDFDGVTDMVVGSNLPARDFINNNFQKTVWFYKNTGSNQLPAFSFIKPAFLQDQMIDVGDYAVPAFADADGDDDFDMFISTYAGVNFSSSIFYFENTGSPAAPEFKLRDNNFLFFSFGTQYNLKIQFADVNADGKLDLAYSATQRNNGVTSLFYRPNTAERGLSLDDPIPLNVQIGRTENAHLTDVNQDGLLDMLLGKASGSLQFWRNNGTASTPVFSQISGNFLGIANNFDFQSMALSVSDVDADGRDDLLIGTGRGRLSIIPDFRSTSAGLPAIDNLIANPLTKEYESQNLGGLIWPVAVNMFNSDKPAIVVGNTLGGLQVLRNDGGKDLPEEPQLDIYPNPVEEGKTLFLKSDRKVTVQLYTMIGQKISEPFVLLANQQNPLPINTLAAGMYVVRYQYQSRSYGKKFIVR